MADSIIAWISHHFLEVFGLATLILHGLHILLKQSQPVLEEARTIYVYIKSWKEKERAGLSEGFVTTSTLPPKT